MSNPDITVLHAQVNDVNKLIRESKGLVGFSLTVNRKTGVLEEVRAYPFAGVGTINV